MSKYRLKWADRDYTWEAVNEEEFMDGLRRFTVYPSYNDVNMRKTIAASFCDWSGAPVRYDTSEHLISDLSRAGHLEVTGA